MLRALLLFALVWNVLGAQTHAGIEAALRKPLLDQQQSVLEVQAFTAARVAYLSVPDRLAEWEAKAADLRRAVLDRVVFRGEAARWRDAPAKVEPVGEPLVGKGYRLQKLRYQVIPNLWLPAYRYEPLARRGRVPAVLNVNGHEGEGVATPYIQQRCIHLARNGAVALTFEWFGRGALANNENFNHYRMPQIDLTGTSGVALFFLAHQRALDLLIADPQVDPRRVAVTGLSGGGWQTIFLSALDPRVALANPVAGYSSYVTRTQWPELDLGDSEQTPSDLAALADYTHLTALLAPRPLLLSYNQKDTCCFRADYAYTPLLQAAGHVFALYPPGGRERLRYHVNYGPGHNYDADNREAFYRMLREFFFSGVFPVTEEPADGEIRTAAQLAVPFPAGNLDFHSLALELSKDLPRDAAWPAEPREALAWQHIRRAELRSLVRMPAVPPRREMVPVSESVEEGIRIRHAKLRLGQEWTLPLVEFVPEQPRETALLVAEEGRASLAARVQELLREGRRVVALDPFYFGEAKIARQDFLFALLVAGVGERPLGLQAGGIEAAAAVWAEQTGQPVAVEAHGPRISVAALAAAATASPAVIGALDLYGSFGSLKEVIERNLRADQTPELFCFGLLERFDLRQMVALAAPRPVRFFSPSERVRAEMRGLGEFYRMLGREHDPVGR
jgi:dienelactone hydrolase